ncbi:lipase family protein [Caballeronia sp. KNU42]
MNATKADPQLSLEHPPLGDAPNRNNLYFTAVMSQMAYSLEEHSGKRFGGGELSHFKFGIVRGLVLDSPSVLVIAFSGSQTWKDWLSNLDMRKVRTPFGGVHSGFMRSLRDIQHEVLPYIWTLSIVNKPIVICGHSRGGALAMLLAAILHNRGTPVHSVFTFCSPKVGGSDFAEYWQRTGVPLYLLVNGNDVVPSLPPSSWGEWLRLVFYVIPLNLLLFIPPMLLRRLFKRKPRDA